MELQELKVPEVISRRHARERAMQIIYAHVMTKDPIDPIIARHLTGVKDKKIELFAEKLIRETIDNDIQFENLIKETVPQWDIERIAILDSILIKMCLTEFLFFSDVPTKVTIFESVDLAKQFSTKNSGKFVNGVVDALLGRLVKEGKIKKKGRGLRTESKPVKTKKKK